MQPSHPTDQPPRRSFLKWATHGLGAVFAVILGVPAAAYVIDPRNRPKIDRDFRTVDGVIVTDLVAGIPVQGVIRDVRTDAWTLHPNDVVGRVWVVKEAAGKINVYTTICPHLGCSINLNLPSGFECPCHGAKFDVKGDVLQEPGHENPAPRPMDSLESRPDPADPTRLIQVKYVNYKQGEKDKKPVA